MHCHGFCDRLCRRFRLGRGGLGDVRYRFLFRLLLLIGRSGRRTEENCETQLPNGRIELGLTHLRAHSGHVAVVTGIGREPVTRLGWEGAHEHPDGFRDVFARQVGEPTRGHVARGIVFESLLLVGVRQQAAQELENVCH